MDDVASNLEVVGSMLADFNCRVFAAKNGVEAIDWLRENDADLILMDLHMPVLDGISAAETIQKLPGSKAKIPIYAWTADVTSAVRL